MIYRALSVPLGTGGRRSRTKTILRKGFGATSIEEVIAEAGITKSGFLYHFSNKNALADMVSTVIEGGLVLGRATGDRALLPHQLMLLRSYIKLLFEPGASR